MRNTAIVILSVLGTTFPAFSGGQPIATTPEPSSVILLATIAAGIGGLAWYKSRAKKP
jgi:hypothetical protein